MTIRNIYTLSNQTCGQQQENLVVFFEIDLRETTITKECRLLRSFYLHE